MPRLNRILTFLAVTPLVWLTGCGSSGTTATAPSSLTRCAVTVSITDAQLPAQGASGTVQVATARECAWTASAEGAWLNIKSGANGQGDGAVEFSAAANIDPVTRRGALIVNAQRAELTQAAAECELSLMAHSGSFAQAGGSGQVEIRASSGLCQWTASTDADWITLRRTSGQGTGQIPFDVQPTMGPPRTGSIVVGGKQFSVMQSEGCAFSIAPAAYSAPAAGGTAVVSVTTTAACPWTASSNVPWVTFDQTSGSGPGSTHMTVAAYSGAGRTGTAAVAGQMLTVTQAPGCTYLVQPLTSTVPAAGGNVTVSVISPDACPWTASTDVPWISLAGGSSGSGNGSVTLTVAATSGPARSGSATVAGQRVTVSQGVGCSYNIAPASATIPSSGGSGRVAVTAGEGCEWTASSAASWLSVTSGAKGTGSGEVVYSAEPTTGPGRSATMTIAGQTFTLNQGQGCSYTLSSSSTKIDDEGGQGSFKVETTTGCGWSVSSAVPWITVTSPASVTGGGTVRFTVAANGGPSRSGAITAAGQTFTVSQGNGCSYALSSSSQNLPAAGGTGSVNVTTGNGCGWSATSNASWLTITSAQNATGNGTVAFNAAAHTGSARSGTLTIAGRTFTVNQAESCTFSISPEQATIDAAGGSRTVNVSAPAGCGWASTSNVPWMRVTSGPGGSGSGAVQLAIDGHTGPARTGTATIAGRTFTVTQSESCTFAVNPEQASVNPAGETVTVNITGTAGCGWTASSTAAWIRITSAAAGDGNGSVQLAVDGNTGPARSGTVTVAGRAVTITQGESCGFAISPEQLSFDPAGGTTTVTVTAANGCNWSSAAHVPWLRITSSGTGTGGGTVQIAVDPNAGAARSGTATIAGRTFTVNQSSGCSYSLSPGSHNAPASISTVSVGVATADSCAWAASSNVPWITVNGANAGSGNGAVQLDIAANTGPARAGTVTIGGQAFSVNQESGCTVALSASAQPMPTAGGPGSVGVTAGAGCAWTAVSQVPWITVIGGASGSGDGAVQFSVEPNATGAPRSGAIVIGGVTFAVNQS